MDASCAAERAHFRRQRQSARSQGSVRPAQLAASSVPSTNPPEEKNERGRNVRSRPLSSPAADRRSASLAWVHARRHDKGRQLSDANSLKAAPLRLGPSPAGNVTSPAPM